jgi:hypothetical protein
MIISQVRNFGGALALAQGVAAHGQIDLNVDSISSLSVDPLQISQGHRTKQSVGVILIRITPRFWVTAAVSLLSGLPFMVLSFFLVFFMVLL